MTIDPLKRRKIVVLGSRSVGKTSLVIQFVENQYYENYCPTIENTYSKSIKYNGVEYDVDILDTAGQDEYTLISSAHTFGVHGFVLVYSVTNRNSFDLIQTVHDKIINYSGMGSIPCVVVGQMCDLNDQRQVKPAEVQKLAESIGSAWVETSARQNTNVAKVFDLCLAEIEKSINPPQPAPGKCIIM